VTTGGSAGPVRAVLRAFEPDPVHPALPAGYGLELSDLQAYRHLGSATPDIRTPPHAGVEITTAPWARAWPPRWAWRWPRAASVACSTRTPHRVPRPSTPRVRDRLGRRHDGGVTAEGRVAGRPSGAGEPGGVLRRQPHLHRGRHRRLLSEDVPARYAAYGWHVQTVDWTRTGDYVETSMRSWRRSRRPERNGRPSLIMLPYPDRLAGSGPGRTPGKAHARRSATRRSPRPRSCWARSERTFVVEDESWRDPRRLDRA